MKATIRGTVALLSAAALFVQPLAVVAAPSRAPARIHGRVLAPDLKSPMPGLEVQAIPAGGTPEVVSATTDALGRFSLPGLAPGDYVLLVASPEGAPLAAARVSAAAGEDRTVHLGLPELAPGESRVAPAVAASGDDDSMDSDGHGGGFGHFVKTPLGATIIFVVGAVVFAGVGDALTGEGQKVVEQEPPVTPSAP